MSIDINKFLDFHKENGGTGKLFNFKFKEYKEGFLELSGEFNELCLNPDGSVQGGMMTSMLDDVTALLLIYESGGLYILARPIYIHSITDLFLKERSLLEQYL